MTKKMPDPNQDMLAQESELRPRKVATKPGRDVNEVLRVSDDPEIEPEYLITLPAHVDARKFVKRNYGGGDYLVKNKVGGKFKGERELHIEFQPEEQTDVEIEYEEPERDFGLRPIPVEVPEDSDERIARIVAKALEERDRRERAVQGQPSALDMMLRLEEVAEKKAEREQRRRVAMMEELRAMNPQQPDQFKMLETMLDRALRMADKLSPVRELEGSKGVMSELLGFARDTAPQWVPGLMAAINAKRGNGQPARPTAPVQPVSPPPPQPVQSPLPNSTPVAVAAGEEESFDEAAAAVLMNLMDDLSAGANVRNAANDLLNLVEDFPQESGGILLLLEQPPGIVAQQLSAYMPNTAEVLAKPESVAWLGQLQAEILARRVPHPIEPPANGDGQLMADVA